MTKYDKKIYSKVIIAKRNHELKDLGFLCSTKAFSDLSGFI